MQTPSVEEWRRKTAFSLNENYNVRFDWKDIVPVFPQKKATLTEHSLSNIRRIELNVRTESAPEILKM